MTLEVKALIVLTWLALAVLAATSVVAADASPAVKIAWLVALFVLPFVGIAVWLVFGPRASDREL